MLLNIIQKLSAKKLLKQSFLSWKAVFTMRQSIQLIQFLSLYLLRCTVVGIYQIPDVIRMCHNFKL